MNRRDILKAGATAALVSPLSLKSVFAAESGPIMFGAPNPMSGPFAANGKFAAMGTDLILSQTKTVLGQSLAHKVLDTQGKPAIAIRQVQDAFEKDKAHFFAGGILSSEALAMGKTLDKLGGIFVTTAGADEITGTDCNRGTFRWSVPTFGAIRETVGPLIKLHPKAKRWYTITPQYVFGEGLLGHTKNILKENNLEHVGNSYHSLDEREFSGYLTNAMAAKPDVLVLLNFGSQSSEALRQAVSFGLKTNTIILMAWASGLEQFDSLGADLCEDVYFGVQYWHTVDAPMNKTLVEQCRAKFNITPNYSLAGAYICTKMMLDGIAKANSTDTAKVIAAMEGAQYDGLTGKEEIRKADHQVLKNYYLLKGKAKAKMADKDDYCDIVSEGQSFLSPADAGCKMPA
ncbi:ABC transporter substrate-binding protein [Pollutimonas bauzanensis]|uniref:ABC transporter substrate-binding protein n=1 Tax=Pollutimonas bauzanensis TaxID=658167 RepID=UPI00333FC0F6